MLAREDKGFAESSKPSADGHETAARPAKMGTRATTGDWFVPSMRAFVLALSGAVPAVLPLGCAPAQKVQQSHIVAHGKAVSFDLMDAHIENFEGLRSDLKSVVAHERILIDGMVDGGPNWLSENVEKVKSYQVAVASLKTRAETARRSDLYHPFLDPLTKLDGSLHKVVTSSPVQGDTIDSDKLPRWLDSNKTLREDATALLQETDPTSKVLAKIAMQALYHEAAHSITQFIDTCTDHGPEWIRDPENCAAIVNQLDRVVAHSERYAERADLRKEEDRLLAILTSARDARALIEDTDRFTNGGKIDFTAEPHKRIADLRDQLVAMKDWLREGVDAVDPEIQRGGAEILKEPPKSGRGSVIFVQSVVYNSGSSSASHFGGGRGFVTSGGAGKFSPPVSGTVSRGGFGATGARMGGGFSSAGG